MEEKYEITFINGEKLTGTKEGFGRIIFSTKEQTLKLPQAIDENGIEYLVNIDNILYLQKK